MLQSLRDRQPGRPLYRVIWWYFMHALCFVWCLTFYRFRARGVDRIPRTGPVLFLCNHQSFLDPILVGLGAHRRQFYAMGRHTLWKPWLAGLMNSLNGIPLRQGESDTQAIRTTIEVLKKNHALLVFPEGARTLSGVTEEFAPGVMLIIKRARPMIVPVAIEGAFDVWPRGQAAPKLFGRVRVEYGEPIPAEDLIKVGTKAALVSLQEQIEAMRLSLKEPAN